MADLNQIKALMAQYKQDGGDAGALAEAYTTLFATGKTPLGLNQWVKSDKPMMEDFNEDNRIVDRELRRLSETITNKPQRINFPLEGGLVGGTFRYWITIFGEVHIAGEVDTGGGLTPGSTLTIGTIPNDYRPQSEERRPCILRAVGTTSAYPTMCVVSTAGVLTVPIPQSSTGMRIVVLDISYISA